MAKINWKSQADLDAELQEQETLRIKEEEKKSKIEKTPERVSVLEDDNLVLMTASAESYEQMYKENMSLMLAVAEMYEEIQLIKGGTL